MNINNKIRNWFRPVSNNGFHISTFFSFVLLAFVLWYGHAVNSVRERSVSIAVVYVGVPDEVKINLLPLFTPKNDNLSLKSVVSVAQNIVDKFGGAFSPSTYASNINNGIQGSASRAYDNSMIAEC